MPRVEDLASAARQRELSELEAQRPELAPWLRPLRISLLAIGEEPWRSMVPLTATTRAADAPLLHGAMLPVDEGAARAHVRTVLAAAFGSSARAHIDHLELLLLLEQALAHDDAGIAELAALAELDADALAAGAQIALLPLLLSAARTVAPQPITSWPYGYCPVCGARPVLAEMLGLERARQLRCGRCGTGWKSQVLLCPFCDERDHARLGSLVPDGAAGQVAWVETCSSCKGYIKARAALRAAAAENVLIEDARTLELDLVAMERGYRKPATGAFPTRARLARLTLGVS